MATLRAAGVPIEHPEHGWYRVPEHWIPSGTVDVKTDELLALYVARQLAPGLRSSTVGHALDSLWAKLSTSDRQPSLPLGDDSWLDPRSLAAIDYGPHRAAIDVLREAIRGRRAVAIHYRKPGGEDSERVVEPVLVRWEPAAEALYLFAWCRLRDQLRTFALHRIVTAQLTGDHFAPRRDAIAEADRAFRLWTRPGVEHVTLRFSPRVAGEVRERRWHASERWTDSADGGVTLEMDIAAPEELDRWLLGFGADVVVEAPASLATRIQARHVEAAGSTRLGLLPARRLRLPRSAAPRRRARREV